MPDDDVFRALANPVRRRLLESLRDGPRAVNDLAGQFDLGRPAVSEHLQVLRLAHLVREEPRGRERYYHLQADRLAEVSTWLHPFEHYWRARLADLHDVLADDAPTGRTPTDRAPTNRAPTNRAATDRAPTETDHDTEEDPR